MTIHELDAAVRAVCPIIGISVGDWSDKATWRIDFQPAASPAEQLAAQAVFDGWAGATEVGLAKGLKSAAVTARREQVFSAGYSPSSGPLAGHTLQCRDVQDRTNWLTSAVGYSAAVQAGAGSVEGATFRTQDNETVVTTYAEAVTVLLQGMQVWGQQIMQRSWALKDEIDACETVEAVEAIDITTGWPS